MIFLTGFIIERLKDEEMAHKGYYGFEIMHQEHSQPSNPEHHRYALITVHPFSVLTLNLLC